MILGMWSFSHQFKHIPENINEKRREHEQSIRYAI